MFTGPERRKPLTFHYDLRDLSQLVEKGSDMPPLMLWNLVLVKRVPAVTENKSTTVENSTAKRYNRTLKTLEMIFIM